MTRLVRGADGRTWTIRTRVEWRNVTLADEFEHDVTGGSAPAGFLLGLCAVLLIGLLVWTPDGVIVPDWLLLALILVLLFFPARWVWLRPWTVVVETAGDLENEQAECWVGQVRGLLRVRHEVNQLARNIEVYSTPDRGGTGKLILVE